MKEVFFILLYTVFVNILYNIGYCNRTIDGAFDLSSLKYSPNLESELGNAIPLMDLYSRFRDHNNRLTKYVMQSRFKNLFVNDLQNYTNNARKSDLVINKRRKISL